VLLQKGSVRFAREPLGVYVVPSDKEKLVLWFVIDEQDPLSLGDCGAVGISPARDLKKVAVPIAHVRHAKACADRQQAWPLVPTSLSTVRTYVSDIGIHLPSVRAATRVIARLPNPALGTDTMSAKAGQNK